MTQFFIDGDFPSRKGDCPYHCSPTCHPAQIGPDWEYGCTHKAWPANRYGDFVPIVFCGGEKSKCELKGKKFVAHYLRGKNLSIKYALAKIGRLQKEIQELKEILII